MYLFVLVKPTVAYHIITVNISMTKYLIELETTFCLDYFPEVNKQIDFSFIP